LVDDEPAILLVLELLLAGQGHRVITARNGAKALDAALAHAPHLANSDWMMPVMHGTQLYRCFQGIPSLSAIPFVFMSAAIPPNEVRQGAFLRKPFDPPLELELIQRCSAGSRAPKHGSVFIGAFRAKEPACY
jgi:CheY-like chemotaxis protein